MQIVHKGETVEASIVAVRVFSGGGGQVYASDVFDSEADFKIGDEIVTKKLYTKLEEPKRGRGVNRLQEGVTVIYNHPKDGEKRAEGFFEAGDLNHMGVGKLKVRIKQDVNWSAHWATYLADCVLEVFALPTNRWNHFTTAPKFYVATPKNEVLEILRSINLSLGMVNYDPSFDVQGQEIGDWLFPEYCEIVSDDTPIGLPYKLIRVPVDHEETEQFKIQS